MNNEKRLNQHQRGFLRNLRRHPAGLPESDWPSAAALRRWMRHSGFRRALDSVRAALQIRTDFELVTASVRASSDLTPLLENKADKDEKSQIHSRVQLLRLVHWRLKEIRQAHEALGIREAHVRDTEGGGDPRRRSEFNRLRNLIRRVRERAASEATRKVQVMG